MYSWKDPQDSEKSGTDPAGQVMGSEKTPQNTNDIQPTVPKLSIETEGGFNPPSDSKHPVDNSPRVPEPKSVPDSEPVVKRVKKKKVNISTVCPPKIHKRNADDNTQFKFISTIDT